MLGLPKSTEINKFLPKKTIFKKFKPTASQRRLFDSQISRLAIVAEISSQTVNFAVGNDVVAIFVVHAILKGPICDKRNIILLSKLINQNMLFALQYETTIQLAVYRAGKVLFSERKEQDEWHLDLIGLNLDAVWANLIAQSGNITLADTDDLDATIVENEHRKRLEQQIAKLEHKAKREKQPRRKWEYVEMIRKLVAERGDVESR